MITLDTVGLCGMTCHVVNAIRNGSRRHVAYAGMGQVRCHGDGRVHEINSPLKCLVEPERFWLGFLQLAERRTRWRKPVLLPYVNT